MIDIILNSHGGLILVHDERRLDGYTEVLVEAATGAVRVKGSGDDELPIGTLKKSMLQMVTDGMDGTLIRMSNASLAKVSPIKVSVLP